LASAAASCVKSVADMVQLRRFWIKRSCQIITAATPDTRVVELL
jgi:hypothetical protein